MRTVARTMTVIAVIALALSAGADRAADPPPAGRGRQLQFALAEGSVITGRTDVKVVTIRIVTGDVLEVPLTDLTELSVGLTGRKDRHRALWASHPRGSFRRDIVDRLLARRGIRGLGK